jgi:hypothetical protein
MAPKEGVFDEWDPANISPLVSYLSSTACRFTGETFFAQGGVVKRVRSWEMGDTVEQHVVSVTDHRNFNIDVPYMQDINPTTENVVVGMWRVLEPVVAPGKLVRLRLWETENNYVDYEGE